MLRTYNDCDQFDLLASTVRDESELDLILIASNNKQLKVSNKIKRQEEGEIIYENGYRGSGNKEEFRRISS